MYSNLSSTQKVDPVEIKETLSGELGCSLTSTDEFFLSGFHSAAHGAFHLLAQLLLQRLLFLSQSAFVARFRLLTRVASTLPLA